MKNITLCCKEDQNGLDNKSLLSSPGLFSFNHFLFLFSVHNIKKPTTRTGTYGALCINVATHQVITSAALGLWPITQSA